MTRRVIGALAFIILALGFTVGILTGKKIYEPVPVTPSPARSVTLPLPTVSVQVPPPPAPACQDRNYTVEKGHVNSLWRVAAHEYGGRAYFWQLIAEKNGIKVPYVIHVGQVLKIPCCLCDLQPLTPKPVVKHVVRRTVVKTTAKKSAAPVATPAVVTTAPAVPQSSPASPQVAPAPQVPAVPVPQAPAVKPAEAAPQLNLRVDKPMVDKPKSEIKIPHTELPLPKYAPGSAWNSFGNSPLEPGNWTNYSHADLGLILGWAGKVKFEPYVAVNTTKDTKGYPWDNKMEGEAGLKIARPSGHGVVEVGVAYAVEKRKDEVKSGPMAFVDGWRGWDQPTRRPGGVSATPGSVQFIAGNISPFEHNNLIAMSRLEQGITVAKAKGISFIPEGWGAIGADSKQYQWNNRITYGGGLKIAIPWNTGTFNVTPGYECSEKYRIKGSESVCGPSIKLDIWTGGRIKVVH